MASGPPIPMPCRRYCLRPSPRPRAWRFEGPEPAIFARAEAALTMAQAEAASQFLQAHDIPTDDVVAVGFHGQTMLPPRPAGRPARADAAARRWRGHGAASRRGRRLRFPHRRHGRRRTGCAARRVLPRGAPAPDRGRLGDGRPQSRWGRQHHVVGRRRRLPRLRHRPGQCADERLGAPSRPRRVRSRRSFGGARSSRRAQTCAAPRSALAGGALPQVPRSQQFHRGHGRRALTRGRGGDLDRLHRRRGRARPRSAAAAAVAHDRVRRRASQPDADGRTRPQDRLHGRNCRQRRLAGRRHRSGMFRVPRSPQP